VAAATQLERLAETGIRIALDDFGTGYSSLAYLKRLPVHAVKIDKVFVDGVEHDTGDRAIVRAVLALASDLGLEVVAEGVETEQQREALGALGCRRRRATCSRGRCRRTGSSTPCAARRTPGGLPDRAFDHPGLGVGLRAEQGRTTAGRRPPAGAPAP
jgi:predicted signal transduction protein with EAL and GGDEF domain